MRLKLNIDANLSVSWIPDADRKLDGEVRRGVILVYNEDPDEAMETLRHEVLDFLVSRVIASHQEITNRFILLLNERAYREKEELVQKLTSLLR